MQKRNPQGNIYDQIKAHISKYTKPCDSLAWQAVGTSAALTIFSVLLINSKFQFLGWIIYTLTWFRWFCQYHQCCHCTFFSNIYLNKVMGTLIGIYGHYPYQAWRDGHNHHHRHFGDLSRVDLSQTILFTKKQYEKMPMPKKLIARILREPIVFFLFTIPFVWFIGLYFIIPRRYGVFSKTFLDKILATVLYLFVFPYLGLPSLKLFISLYVTAVLSIILFHLEHGVNVPYRERGADWDPTRAALQGSTFLTIPFFLKPFTNSVEYHHIHHLNVNVPSVIIQKCHNDFENSGGQKNRWDKAFINRVDYWTSIKSLMNVMLDEDTKQLLPFSYTHL